MQNNMREVKKVLHKHMDQLVDRYDIQLVYTLGSYAKGINRENSDLDIAMYLDGKPEPLIKPDILDDPVRILRREDIDLVNTKSGEYGAAISGYKVWGGYLYGGPVDKGALRYQGKGYNKWLDK